MMSEDEQLRAQFEEIVAIEPVEDQLYVLSGLSRPLLRLFNALWIFWNHDGQWAGPGLWRVWMLMAGRGFGKTRAGAEWVSEMARDHPDARIALVGATIGDVVRVMIEGDSGLMSVARWEEEMIWRPTPAILTFDSGAQAFAYSGWAPDSLRGPQHHFAWCDELAKWKYPEDTWDNLLLGLRLGEDPRVIVTTTPRSIPLLWKIEAHPRTIVTRGRTADNPHNAPGFAEEMADRYAGTRIGRQELDGELIEDVEGALWPIALIERSRAAAPEAFARVVIGVDPPASAGGDACGIVAVGLGEDGVGYVIGDHSVAGLSPEGWAAAVAAAAASCRADRVVAEKNNGGDMVDSVLRAGDCALPVRLVHASRGKAARAEPVAALFEKGKARFAGVFAELERQLAGLAIGGRYEGPGGSPDRADAMVWAFTELMLRRTGLPRVRQLP